MTKLTAMQYDEISTLVEGARDLLVQSMGRLNAYDPALTDQGEDMLDARAALLTTIDTANVVLKHLKDDRD